MIPMKRNQVQNFFSEKEKNHKIIVKDLAENADDKNMCFLSVILIWKITNYG